MKKHLEMIILFCTIIGSVIGGLAYMESRYAMAEEVKKLERRLTLTELRALQKTALENQYFYREQSRKYPADQEIKDKLKEAEDEVADLKEQIRLLTAGEKKDAVQAP